MNERWLPVPIPEYAHLYEVSDLGRVRCTRPWPNLFHRIRKIKTTRDGYTEVVLCRYNIQKKVNVHRLVSEAFLGPLPDGKQTNHKNGDKADNSLLNLEYVTAQQNIQHAFKLGLRQNFGERNYKAKLTDELVNEIRTSKETSIAIAARLGVNKSTIYRARRHEMWKHLK